MGVRDKIVKAIAEKMGIKAYHSSPHDFDKFDLSKIGTGEGAQTYGHGLYFAENPAVSGQGGQYWNQFLNKFPPDERLGAEFLRSKEFNRDAALAVNEANIARLREFYKDSPAEAAPAIARLQKQSEEIASGKVFGPRTYEVNIKADPAQMLDWDKPLSASSPKQVQDAFNQIANSRPEIKDKFYEAFSRKDPGSIYYSILGDTARTGDLARNQVAATNTLREAGIPGIRYLDAGSRGTTGTGSSNYVVFDPSTIDIMKKYGVVAAPAGTLGMGSLYDQTKLEGAQ